MRLRSFFNQRARLAGIVAGLGLTLRCASASPPEQTLEGLAGMLAEASHTHVDPKDIAWEPSPGLLSETFFGRRLLFLGAKKAGEPRDVYRARVRVTLDGKPIGVTQIRNITDTSLGDDAGLDVRGQSAVFATVAYGQIQGISVLELEGARAEDKPDGWFHRSLQAVTAYQITGSFSDIGRTDIVLELPARQATMTLDPPKLQVDLGEPARALVFDTQSRDLGSSDGGQAYAARADVHRQGDKPLVLWAVDTVRAEVGPGPIAWLEEKVFGAKDSFRRATFKVFQGSGAKNTLKGSAETQVKAAVLEATKLTEGDSWPPPAVPSIWTEQKEGEGQWSAVTHAFLKPFTKAGGKDKPPAYFYTTFIRPDPERPYSEVQLIAMDMRQLEIGMQAGFEDPKPLTGPPGDGRLPREKSVLDRIVATFNGAFKTTHGQYGMQVDGRVLLPPVAHAATVMVTKDGDTGIGGWPASTEIPDDIRSFRQNLDPLVEDGVANPTGRYIWGWQISGKSVLSQRTGLCVTPAGHIYYAFGEEIDGPTLGKALRQAGCSYGMHLDMNPGHCGFVYTDIVDMKAREFNLKKSHEAMALSPDKFVRWSAKDFFYVMVRDPVPQDPSGVRWKPDGATQPQPAWLTGIFSGKIQVGSLDIELSSFETGRVDWRVHAGSKEPRIGSAQKELSGDDRHRVLAALDLGHTTEAFGYGLAVGKETPIELRTSYATLVLGPGKAPRIVLPGATLPKLWKDEEAVQLPLLAKEGKLTDEARSHGSMRLRGALCVLPGGRVLLARARHDSSDPIAAALLRFGCTDVVELDRGSQHPAFLHRAGTETPPLASYETSVIYALGRPMLPHAFRWKPDGAAPSKKPTLFDYPDPKKKKVAESSSP
jgi:hypothetical protein